MAAEQCAKTTSKEIYISVISTSAQEHCEWIALFSWSFRERQCLLFLVCVKSISAANPSIRTLQKNTMIFNAEQSFRGRKMEHKMEIFSKEAF